MAEVIYFEKTTHGEYIIHLLHTRAAGVGSVLRDMAEGHNAINVIQSGRRERHSITSITVVFVSI